jgi:hypothetical protein
MFYTLIRNVSFDMESVEESTERSRKNTPETHQDAQPSGPKRNRGCDEMHPRLKLKDGPGAWRTAFASTA